MRSECWLFFGHVVPLDTLNTVFGLANAWQPLFTLPGKLWNPPPFFFASKKYDADFDMCRWDHETNKQGNEGFMGKVQAFRKKADAKLVEKTVPSDPSKV